MDPLLGGGDATGILADQDIRQGLGKGDLLLFDDLFVADDAHRGLGADEAHQVHIQLYGGVDLDDVLFAKLGAIHVLQNRHGAIEGAQPQHMVEGHGLPCGDVVDDDAVFDAVDSHTCTSRSFKISAIRINLP